MSMLSWPVFYLVGFTRDIIYLVVGLMRGHYDFYCCICTTLQLIQIMQLLVFHKSFVTKTPLPVIYVFQLFSCIAFCNNFFLI